MKRWQYRLKDEYTGEEVFLEAQSRESLENKIQRQRKLWEKQQIKTEAEEDLILLEDQVESYKETINEFCNIINRDYEDVIYDDFYEEIDEEDGVIGFTSSLEKPTLESVFFTYISMVYQKRTLYLK